MPLSTSRVAVYIQFKLMSYVRENEEICVVFTVQVCKNASYVLILGDALPLEVITIKQPLNMLRTDVS